MKEDHHDYGTCDHSHWTQEDSLNARRYLVASRFNDIYQELLHDSRSLTPEQAECLYKNIWELYDA